MCDVNIEQEVVDSLGRLDEARKAEELLADFGRVWTLEDDPAKRRRLLATLFDRVWQDGGTVVAVKQREAVLRYFQTADELARRREKKRGVKAGATGLEPATSGVTESRSARKLLRQKLPRDGNVVAFRR